MDQKKPLFHIGRLSGAGKWITVSVTTVAAIVGILVNARNLGLTPWLNVGTVSFADLAARRILLAPPTDTLHAVGDTLHLAATVTDDHGAMLAGATIVWSTDDTLVATVDSSGGVVARGPGTATIIANVREHSARSRVTVWQRVRSVAISHDTLLRLPEGAAVQLVARALDERGHPVGNRAITWKSDDTMVVAVREGGAAVANMPGRTMLTASTDGYTATIPAEVSLSAAGLKVVSGDEQRGPAGKRLPQPVEVQVYSRTGRAVPDAFVSFTSAGEGVPGSETVSTDRRGRARTTWTLGPHPGRQHLLVSVGGADSTVTLVAEADPVPGNIRLQPVEDSPRGPAGSLLPDSVGVHVTDAEGVAATDVPLAWAALDGGKIEALSARTDSVGLAWARWTLGPKAGIQRARVQVGNPRTVPPFTITAVALAESASAVALLSGGNQQGKVGTALPKPVVAAVTDRNGNAVGDVAVRVTAHDGAVADSAPRSDAQGRVEVRWTLSSKAGPQTLELDPGTGTTITVSARGLPLEPANVTPGEIPASALPGRALPKPVTVTVTDAYSNPIPDVQVVFGVTTGRVVPTRVMTNAKGQAATKWTLGPATGDQVLTASVRGAAAAKTTITVAATRPGAPAATKPAAKAKPVRR